VVKQRRRHVVKPDPWGVDVRGINAWLKANVPFYARIVHRRGGSVDIGTDVAHDLGPYAAALGAAFGVRVDQPGMKNYLRVQFPFR